MNYAFSDQQDIQYVCLVIITTLIHVAIAFIICVDGIWIGTIRQKKRHKTPEA